MTRLRSETVAWTVLLVVAGALAGRAVWMWITVLLGGAPVLYGEGAVAHAGQILARGGDPYAIEPAGTFVAANYPPLAFVVAALGLSVGPFVALRLASIAMTLGLAVLVARRAGGGLAGISLGVAMLALFPIEIWGAAAKPDPLAVGLAALAIVVAGPRWPRASASGLLAALAILAKPTALLPLVAVAGYLAVRERPVLRRSGLVFAVTLLVGAALIVLRSGVAGPLDHMVRRNALGFSVDALLQLVIVGALTVGAFAVLAGQTADARMRAYVVGAAATVLLGGREGATINYLFDLGVASSLALASAAATLRSYAPLALGAQLLVGVALFHPFESAATTGAWGDPARLRTVPDVSGTNLAEDSGLLIARRSEPVVDDLFLWARLVTIGAHRDDITPRVRAGEFATVLSEVDLATLERAPAYERQRWTPELSAAVLDSYRLDGADAGVFRYVPR